MQDVADFAIAKDGNIDVVDRLLRDEADEQIGYVCLFACDHAPSSIGVSGRLWLRSVGHIRVDELAHGAVYEHDVGPALQRCLGLCVKERPVLIFEGRQRGECLHKGRIPYDVLRDLKPLGSQLSDAEGIAEAENRASQIRERVERLRNEGSDAAQAQETLQVVSRNSANLYVQQAVLGRTVWAWHSAKAG